MDASPADTHSHGVRITHQAAEQWIGQPLPTAEERGNDSPPGPPVLQGPPVARYHLHLEDDPTGYGYSPPPPRAPYPVGIASHPPPPVTGRPSPRDRGPAPPVVRGKPEPNGPPHPNRWSGRPFQANRGSPSQDQGTPHDAHGASEAPPRRFAGLGRESHTLNGPHSTPPRRAPLQCPMWPTPSRRM